MMGISYVLRYGVLDALTSITELELEILRLLKDGEKTPREISKILGKADSQILHILKSLKDKGIVTSRKGKGRTVYYAIKEDLSWISLAIECLDVLTYYDNKVIQEFLSDKRLSDEQKRLAITRYFELREKALKELLQKSYEQIKSCTHSSRSPEESFNVFRKK